MASKSKSRARTRAKSAKRNSKSPDLVSLDGMKEAAIGLADKENVSPSDSVDAPLGKPRTPSGAASGSLRGTPETNRGAKSLANALQLLPQGNQRGFSPLSDKEHPSGDEQCPSVFDDGSQDESETEDTTITLSRPSTGSIDVKEGLVDIAEVEKLPPKAARWSVEIPESNDDWRFEDPQDRAIRLLPCYWESLPQVEDDCIRKLVKTCLETGEDESYLSLRGVTTTTQQDSWASEPIRVASFAPVYFFLYGAHKVPKTLVRDADLGYEPVDCDPGSWWRYGEWQNAYVEGWTNEKGTLVPKAGSRVRGKLWRADSLRQILLLERSPFHGEVMQLHRINIVCTLQGKEVAGRAFINTQILDEHYEAAGEDDNWGSIDKSIEFDENEAEVDPSTKVADFKGGIEW